MCFGRKVLAGALLFAPVCFAQEDVNAAATPEAAVETLHDALASVAAEYGDASLEERYRQIEPIVLATHDLPYIAELTIRRQWADLNADQRRRFVEAFTRLSVTTYAGRFRNLEAGMFTIEGGSPVGEDRAEVDAVLTTPSEETIPFQYVLHESGGGWKIINILADNVSDLALKRAEYRRLLQDASIEDLIAALERQTAELAAAK